MSRCSLAFAVAAMVMNGCGGQAPGASPGAFTEVVAALVLHGVTVHEHVSGDDGCSRVELHDNAARLTVTMSDDPERRDIYLFRWRRAADFESSATSFFMCVGDFRSNHQGTVIDVVEISPWRAFGDGWSDALELAVRESLRT